MRLFYLLFLLFLSTNTFCQTISSQISGEERDSIISTIMRTISESKKNNLDNSVVLPDNYDLVDSTISIIGIHGATLNRLGTYDYSKSIVPFIHFYGFTRVLYKKNNDRDTFFAVYSPNLGGILGGPASLSWGLNKKKGRAEELSHLIELINLKKDAIVWVTGFCHFFVIKENRLYVYMDNKLEPAELLFSRKYSIEKFRTFTWDDYECMEDSPIRMVTAEEIQSKKVVTPSKEE